MKHFKLSKKLTLGQKVFVLMMTFCVGVMNLSLTTVSAEVVDATVTTTTTTTTAAPEVKPAATPHIRIGADGSVDINPNIDPAVSANACEAINDDLDIEVRSMMSACSGARLGGDCLETLFQCNEDNKDSEDCQSLNGAMESSASEQQKDVLEEQKEALESLKDQKDAIQKQQEQKQEQIDGLNSDFADRLQERRDLDLALEDSIKGNNENTTNAINGIRESMSALESQSQTVFAQIADQQRQMNQFMLAERLTCKAESKVESQKFYGYLRSCSEGRRQGCNLSFQSFARNGNNSYADMAQAYERRKNRECLRIDSDSAFSIKYKALHAQIESNKALLGKQNAAINLKSTELMNSIQIAQAKGQLANAQETVRNAANVQLHDQETQRLQLRITQLSDSIKNDVNQVKSLEDRIDEQTDTIKDSRDKMTSSLNSDDLKKLREAQLNAQRILNEAQAAKTNDSCECSGAIQTISDRSGVNFCGSTTDESPAEYGTIQDAAE